MFSYKSTDTLSMRTDLDIRSSRPTRELRISAMDYERWVSELLKIERSGPKSNTLAATIDGFLPEVNLTQIQSVGDQGLVINRYGPLLSRNYKRQNLNFCHKKVTEPGLERRSWNMLSQDFVALPTNSTPVNWHSAGYMEDGIIALQGSRSTASSKHLDVLYGLKEGGVVWTHEDDFGDATMAPRRISYGQFCANSEHPALIQQHDGLHVSKFTLNALGNGAKNAPFGQRDSWTTLTAQYVLSHSDSRHLLISIQTDLFISASWDCENTFRQCGTRCQYSDLCVDSLIVGITLHRTQHCHSS